MPLALSHTNALRLALISTGRAMKLNSVVTATRMIPASRKFELTSSNKIPANSTHVMMFEANEPTRTTMLRQRTGP